MDAAVQEDAASRGAVHLDLQDRLQWILHLCRSAIGIYVDFPESFLRNAFVFVDPKSCGYGAEVCREASGRLSCTVQGRPALHDEFNLLPSRCRRLCEMIEEKVL